MCCASEQGTGLTIDAGGAMMTERVAVAHGEKENERRGERVEQHILSLFEWFIGIFFCMYDMWDQ